MTPAQQAAIEALAGRALSAEEIQFAEDRRDACLAQSISIGRKTIASRLIGIGTVLAELAPNGGAFLDAVAAIAAADSNVKWALKMIEADTFDAGMPVTRGMVQQLAADHPEVADAVAKLLALAEVPAPVDFNELSTILNG